MIDKFITVEAVVPGQILGFGQTASDIAALEKIARNIDLHRDCSTQQLGCTTTVS